MSAPLELVGLGSSSSMDSFASWKMNGSGMEKEEREEMPLQGKDGSRRSSPPLEAMDKSLEEEWDEWRETERRAQNFGALRELWNLNFNFQMIKVEKNPHMTSIYSLNVTQNTLPTYSRYCRLPTDYREIEVALCIPGWGFILNAKGHPRRILRKDLTTLAQVWSVLSYSNLAPTSHTSDLAVDRARLFFGLVSWTWT